VSNFTTRPNLDNRDFTQTSGSTLNLYGNIIFDKSIILNGVNINASTGSSLFGYVLTHTANGIELKAPSGFTSGGGSGGVGDITGATNIGGGVGVFAQKNNKDFEFKSFIPLSAMTISGNSDLIYFGVNIDETRTQNRNTVPNSKLLDDQLIIINTGATFNRSYQLPVALISGISSTYIIDLSQGELHTLLLSGNTTLNYTGHTIGKTYTLIIKKETTNKTLSFTTGRYMFPFGTEPVTTDPTANGSSPAKSDDILTLLCVESARMAVVSTPNLINN
jgi:hypothetical protein